MSETLALLCLRWVEDGVWFEMIKSGSAEAIGYLDQAVLMQLAESLILRP